MEHMDPNDNNINIYVNLTRGGALAEQLLQKKAGRALSVGVDIAGRGVSRQKDVLNLIWAPKT